MANQSDTNAGHDLDADVDENVSATSTTRTDTGNPDSSLTGRHERHRPAVSEADDADPSATADDEAVLSVENVHDLPASAKSYIYIRVAVLVVIAGLAISIVIERWFNDVQLESISAYYFTPVHSLFIGALLALSTVMIALRSDDDLEDLLLNVAGALAAVVALVPTARPEGLTGDTTVVIDADALIRNNMVALLGALGLVVVITVAFASRRGQRSAIMPTERANWISLGLSTALLVAGAVWYWAGRQSFLRSAHFASAAVMFVLILVDVIVNGWRGSRFVEWLRRLVDSDATTTSTEVAITDLQQLQYRLIAAWLVGGGLVAWGVGGGDRVFWVEAVEIVGFVAFWIVQTGAAVSHANTAGTSHRHPPFDRR